MESDTRTGIITPVGQGANVGGAFECVNCAVLFVSCDIAVDGGPRLGVQQSCLG